MLSRQVISKAQAEKLPVQGHFTRTPGVLEALARLGVEVEVHQVTLMAQIMHVQLPQLIEACSGQSARRRTLLDLFELGYMSVFG